MHYFFTICVYLNYANRAYPVLLFAIINYNVFIYDIARFVSFIIYYIYFHSLVPFLKLKAWDTFTSQLFFLNFKVHSRSSLIILWWVIYSESFLMQNAIQGLRGTASFLSFTPCYKIKLNIFFSKDSKDNICYKIQGYFYTTLSQLFKIWLYYSYNYLLCVEKSQ